MRNYRFNYLLIIHFISIVLIIESIFMLGALIVSILYSENIIFELLKSFLLTFLLGIIIYMLSLKAKKFEPRRKESLVIVSISWIVMAIFGTIPYLMTKTIPSFENAFFEAMSGFTTTGSSILTDVEALPKSILFWRSETHWIGGMGIIVLIIALIPFLIGNNMHLFYSEMSNVVEEKLSIRIKNVAKQIWLVYVFLTLIEIIVLRLAGMNLFDSICHSFATIATGGFSTKNDSIAGYSPFIQYTIMFFMLMSGMNFALHVLGFKLKFRRIFKNEELRFYLFLILLVGFSITFSLYISRSLPFETALRDAFFQVISVITATGFANADYLIWPTHTIVLIIFLMLIGASAGSTGGGVKAIRNLIVLKKISQVMRKIIHPKEVSHITYNQRILNTQQVTSVLSFIILYYFIVASGTVIMMLLGVDKATSFGAVITTMGGIGPGFGSVGPAGNFYHLPVIGKYFLSMIMVIGRLEIYPILIIFAPRFLGKT